MCSYLLLCVFDQGDRPTTFTCPLCGDGRTSHLAHRTQLGLTHQCDLRQVLGVQGRREDRVIPLEGKELARWVDHCHRNHHHCGARARSRSQRRQASASASTPPESSAVTVPEPAASSQAASGGATSIRRLRRRRPRNRSNPSSTAAARQSCFVLGASGGSPRGISWGPAPRLPRGPLRTCRFSGPCPLRDCASSRTSWPHFPPSLHQFWWR